MSIPRIEGDMAALAGHANTIAAMGTGFAATGNQVHATWQGLAVHYIAPEAGQLLAATAPVVAVSASVGEDLESAAAALHDYAAETAAIQTRLEALRVQAGDLVTAMAAAQDESTVTALDTRDGEISAAVSVEVAAWETAQLRCANALRALFGEPRLVEESFVARMAADVNGMPATGVNRIGGPPAPALPAPPPPEPSGGLLEGAVVFVGDLGNEVASFGNAVLNNPGLVVQAGAGAGLAALGGAAVLAGGGISLAPGGAAAGIPLAGAGLAGVAGGSALAGGAITALSAEADGADRVTPFGGSGAEAAAPQPAAEPQPTAEPRRPGANWDAVLGHKPDPDSIHVPPIREIHIIDGDGKVAGDSASGGHLAGTGNPNKMEFPESWDPDRIIDTAVEVAKDPDVEPELQDNGFWKAVGTRDGVSVEVIVLPDGRVWSFYPTGGEGVIKNDEYGNPIPN